MSWLVNRDRALVPDHPDGDSHTETILITVLANALGVILASSYIFD